MVPILRLGRGLWAETGSNQGHFIWFQYLYTRTMRTRSLQHRNAPLPKPAIYGATSSFRHAAMTSLTLSLWIFANQVLAIYARILFPYNINGMRASWLASSTPPNTPEIITA